MPEVGQRRRSHLFGAVLVFLAPVLLLQPAWARSNFNQQGPKLVGTNNIGGSTQGTSVAISADGNTALVGGPRDNSLVGAVWVFTRSNGVWTQQGPELLATGAVGPPLLGFAVALSADGNTAAIGGKEDNNVEGAVWIFTRSNGVWTQEGSKLVGTGGVGSSLQQGSSVALSADGNTVIFGGDNDNGVRGAAWVFTRTNGTWTQQGPKLFGAGTVGGTDQGTSVALSADGNTAVIGGDRDNNGVGAAWVFVRSYGVWTQQGDKLVGTGYVGQPGQGAAVALSADGNTVAIGGPLDNSFVGAAWIFVRSNGVWTQQGSKLIATDSIGTSDQGISVALSADGNTFMMGGGGDNTGIGATWVFTRSNGAWTQRQKLIGTGGGVQSAQGHSIALSAEGHTVLIGGPADNVSVGAAWVFFADNSAHDFNGDGFSDIAWRDTSGNVAIWLMSGATVTNYPTSFVANVAGQWTIVGQRDFNGDGYADLLWHDTSGNVAIWEMNGTTVLNVNSSFVGNVATNWSIVGTGDFNGDGMGDILWQDMSGNVAIWEMNGTTVLNVNSSFVANVAAPWSIVGIGDFDGDGMSDILWRDTTGNVAIWLMNGTQVLQSGGPGQVATSWSVVGTGDFNGDGDADILWRDSEGNTAVWLMNGLEFAEIGALGMVPLSRSVASTGDFNFDGKADILWRDTNSGATTTFYMNGTQISQILGLGVVPTNWAIQGVNAD
jgi:hypothetical protein